MVEVVDDVIAFGELIIRVILLILVNMSTELVVLLFEQVAVGGHIHDILWRELIGQENTIRRAGKMQLEVKTEIDGCVVHFLVGVELGDVIHVDVIELLNFL